MSDFYEMGYKIMSAKYAIVGSGPAGMYAADALLKSVPDCHIDVFEKYPAWTRAK